MNLEFIDKIQERARKAESQTRDQLEKIQSRSRDMVRKNRDQLSERADRSRRSITLAEAQALDVVGAWLDRIYEATGERAEVLDKGRSFIEQVSRDIRLGNLRVDDLPIDDYDSLNVRKVSAALKLLDADQREFVRAYELTHKNRVTVLRAIDELRADGMPEA